MENNGSRDGLFMHILSFMSKDSLIGEFLSIVPTTEERAKSFLEVTKWDLDEAVGLYFESDGILPSPSTSMVQRNSSAAGAFGINGHSSRNDASFPSNTTDLVDNSGFSASGLNSDPSVRAPMAQVVSSLTDSRKRHREERIANYVSMNRSENPFAKLGPMFVIPPHLLKEGTFTHVRHISEHEMKWLIVNIQDTTVFDCSALNRDVWRSPRITELLENSFSLWQQCLTLDIRNSYNAMGTSSEVSNGLATDFIDRYKLGKVFPAICLIDPRIGELLWYHAGPISEPEVFSILTQFLSKVSWTSERRIPQLLTGKAVAFKSQVFGDEFYDGGMSTRPLKREVSFIRDEIEMIDLDSSDYNPKTKKSRIDTSVQPNPSKSPVDLTMEKSPPVYSQYYDLSEEEDQLDPLSLVSFDWRTSFSEKKDSDGGESEVISLNSHPINNTSGVGDQSTMSTSIASKTVNKALTSTPIAGSLSQPHDSFESFLPGDTHPSEKGVSSSSGTILSSDTVELDRISQRELRLARLARFSNMKR